MRHFCPKPITEQNRPFWMDEERLQWPQQSFPLRYCLKSKNQPINGWLYRYHCSKMDRKVRFIVFGQKMTTQNRPFWMDERLQWPQ